MSQNENLLAFVRDIDSLRQSTNQQKNLIWTSQLREFLEQFQISQSDMYQLNDTIGRLISNSQVESPYEEMELFLNLLLRKGVTLKQKSPPLTTVLTNAFATPIRTIEPSISGIPDTVTQRMIAAREESRRVPTQVGTFHTAQKVNVNQIGKTNKIFIVHGHDNESKLELARILDKMGLETIILHEQPNQGKTIMEKFEEYSKDVNYAFVLLTPDDLGGTEKSDLKKRARQNVVLELGFFIAKLGRSRVCCLHKLEVELPTDYLGVIFLPFTKSPKECYEDIIRELKTAGFNLKL